MCGVWECPAPLKLPQCVTVWVDGSLSVAHIPFRVDVPEEGVQWPSNKTKRLCYGAGVLALLNKQCGGLCAVIVLFRPGGCLRRAHTRVTWGSSEFSVSQSPCPASPQLTTQQLFWMNLLELWEGQFILI